MLKAVDIMTEDVIVIRESANVAQAIALMQAQKIRSLIVERQDDSESYGIVTERDIVYQVTALEKAPQTVQVRDIMRHPCITVRPDLSLAEVAQLFANTGIQRAPVVQGKDLLGVISMTDILMKSDVGGEQPADILSQRILDVLQHTRILGDQQEQISQECAVVWDVVEELEDTVNAQSQV